MKYNTIPFASKYCAGALLILLLLFRSFLAPGVICWAESDGFGRCTPRRYEWLDVAGAHFHSHVLEDLLNTSAFLRTGFEKGREAIIISKLLAFTVGHLDLLQQVSLVTHEANVAVGGCILLHGLKPIACDLHRFSTCHVVNNHSTRCAIKVISGYVT